jgi:hypothetical protein
MHISAEFLMMLDIFQGRRSLFVSPILRELPAARTMIETFA